MDARQIERSLAMLFEEPRHGGRQLVFWYDPKGDFSEDFGELSLPQGVEKLTLGDTPFSLKYTLLIEKPETSFLLYAPFEVPAHEDNWLLDLQVQGEVFSADQAALLYRFYGFHDRSLQGYLREHLAFFKAKKRRDALLQLGIGAKATRLELQVGLMSVLAGLRVPDPEQLIRTVLMGGLNPEQNTPWLELGKYDLQGEFWEVVQARLGVSDDALTLRELFVRLALTHLQHDLTVPLPDSLRGKVITPATRAYVFVSNWLRQSSDRQSWKRLSSALAPDLGLEAFAAELSPGSYLTVETFDTFDRALIKAATETLAAGTVEPALSEWLSARRALFWHPDFEREYDALRAAAELVTGLTQYAASYSGSAKVLFERYAETLHALDRSYRHYVSASDRIPHGAFQVLTETLERRYAAHFLEPLGEAWSNALSEHGGSWPFGVEKQWSFYALNVNPVLGRSDKEKVFVIISDAMRFEVASELQGRLMQSLRGETNLRAVQSVLPSITKLGMAALLPHTQLSVNAKGDVLADGRSTKGADARQAVLNAHGVSSLVLSATEALAMTQEDRQRIKPHRVIYIYQDRIDATGDHRASERNVFRACEEALVELEALVKRITNVLNGTTVVLTSDHGFLYQRQPLAQFDKVERFAGDKGVLDEGRRHRLGPSFTPVEGTQNFRLPYLEPSLLAQSPRGTLRYAVQGGGAQYVHGGASLQEVCVPILLYKHVRAEKGDAGASHKVSVRVSTTARRITNTHFTVKLIQDEPIGERVRARQVLVKIVGEDGVDLTNASPLNLDSAARQASDREYIARLTVGPQAPQRGSAFLVVLDAEDTLEILREPWQLSLAFTDDFGDF